MFRNLRKIIREAWHHMNDSDLRWVAGSLAFSTVLSIVPFIALTLSVFRFLGGLEFFEPKMQNFLLQYFQQAVGADATQLLKTTLANFRVRTVGITSIVFLFYTSLRLLQDIEKGISRMWDRHKRTFLKRILISWLLLVVFTIILSVYAGFRSLDLVKPIAKSGRGLLDFTMVLIALFSLYKYLPPVRVRTQSALISAFFASAIIVYLQSSFSWLTKSFFQINKFYGSIATIPLLLTWVLFLWYVILAGAAVAASLDKSANAAAHKRES